MRIIGYAYDSDLHCSDCTFDRFPVCEHGSISCLECEDGGDLAEPLYLGEEFSTPPLCADCGRRLKGRVA